MSNATHYLADLADDDRPTVESIRAPYRRRGSSPRYELRAELRRTIRANNGGK